MWMRKQLAVALTVGALGLGLWAPGGIAQTAPKADKAAATGEAQENQVAEGETEEEAPAFTEAFLNDPAQLEIGRELWEDTCRHCHGRSAYPGKAPKLKPRKYTPDFVYDRVTHGFRKMPAWKDVFSQEERMAISAYVMSKKFAP